MTEQEDILSFYFTIEENCSRFKLIWSGFTIFTGDFDAFVWRLPKGTKSILRYALDECLNV